LPQTPVLEEKSDEEKEDEGKIPSQADIFRSVAEQLSISKAKEGTPLAAIINYVQRTAGLDNLNLILPICDHPRHIITRNPVPNGNRSPD